MECIHARKDEARETLGRRELRAKLLESCEALVSAPGGQLSTPQGQLTAPRGSALRTLGVGSWVAGLLAAPGGPLSAPWRSALQSQLRQVNGRSVECVDVHVQTWLLPGLLEKKSMLISLASDFPF